MLPSDPVRRLILERAKEKGLSQGFLSEQLKKNPAWMNQFLLRGSPKQLEEEDVAILSEVLDVDPDRLRLPSPARRIGNARPSRVFEQVTPANAPTQEALPTQIQISPNEKREIAPERRILHEMLFEASRAASQIPGSQTNVTRFRDTDLLPPELARGRQTFALWITAPRSRLRSGDEVVASDSQPPGVGDLVVVVKDNRVAAVGELHAVTLGSWTVVEQELEIPGGTEREPILRRKCENFPREQVALYKIIFIRPR